MKQHICKNPKCNEVYEYCRGCLLRPISYKENGYCSLACQEASKIKIEEVVPIEDVEVVVIDEDTSTPTESAIEYPFFLPLLKKKIKEEKEENEEDDHI